MNDNLPEINFKEKKEKKRGLLGWLKGRMGAGSGGAMGEAGITPSAMNVGRALGTAKFGASAGLGSFLAGNAATIAMVALVGAAGAMYLVRNAPAPAVTSGAFSSNKTQDNYVPAILRSQAANQGSSLDMFKETNKGAGLAMDESAKAAAKPEEPKASANDEAQSEDPNQPAPDQGNMAQAMMGKLQGGDIGSLTSSLGGGSNKMSGMGGFGNKFNQGATGGKSGFTSGIGTGFQGMAKFDQRKGKMLAMKAASRPVFSSSKAGKKGQFGTGAFGQAKGMRATQKTYSGSSIDSARSTQDKAWEGSTGTGDASGGAGLSDGGAGIVSSPSLDNGTGSTGGGGEEANIPEATPTTDVSPWKSDISNCMSMILMSCVLSFIASKLCASKVFWIYVVGVILAIAALLMALYALVIAIKLMGSQMLLGSLYLLGAGLAVASAVMALMGASKGAGTPAATEIMWLAAGGGLIGLMGSMFSSK